MARSPQMPMIGTKLLRRTAPAPSHRWTARVLAREGADGRAMDPVRVFRAHGEAACRPPVRGWDSHLAV